MDDKHKLSDEDKKLFRNTVKKIKKITPKEITNSLPSTENKKITYSQKKDYSNEYGFFFYASSGMRKKERDLFRKKNIDRHNVDLHGMTREEAKKELIRVLEQSNYQNFLIISGKGLNSKIQNEISPLQEVTQQILSTHHRVKACCQSDEKSGGKGAFYVLLYK